MLFLLRFDALQRKRRAIEEQAALKQKSLHDQGEVDAQKRAHLAGLQAREKTAAEVSRCARSARVFQLCASLHNDIKVLSFFARRLLSLRTLELRVGVLTNPPVPLLHRHWQQIPTATWPFGMRQLLLLLLQCAPPHFRSLLAHHRLFR